MSEFENILKDPVDVYGLIESLDFTEENLVEACLQQGKLFLEASRYRVKKMRRKIEAKAKLEAAETRVSLHYRIKKQKGTRGSMTEGYIRDRVGTHPDVLSAKKKLGEAVVAEEWAEALLEAYKMRDSACRVLSRILGAEAVAEHKAVRVEGEKNALDKMKDRLRSKYRNGHD